jgi:energy-coupling factor transporter ATP-binding protein EcfA2
MDRYIDVVEHKAAGRLPDVGLIFPNVELRFDIGTARNSPVNFHLLFSPDDPNHVYEIRNFLRSLQFQVGGQGYGCERDELIRLGRATTRASLDDTSALADGTNQFKVSVPTLRDALSRNRWARDNVIVAIAGGSTDGSSGLQADSSFATVRREIERLARVVFSSQPAQRNFWLGKGAETIEALNASWGGRKVCLHGSDAHRLEKVGKPDADRFTWIKGDATFESLRQACIEPETRAIIGAHPPDGALPHRTIDTVKIEDARWCTTPEIPLNPGLVGIIGARGSGKTALADFIAAAGHSIVTERNTQSFLTRAAEHLTQSSIHMSWAEGDDSAVALGQDSHDYDQPPQVQYLSQQFVEQLCSSEGITDELLREIERVVYQSHPIENRMGTSTFSELLDLRANRGRALRTRNEQAVTETARQINVERALQAGLPALRAKREADAKAVADDKKARGELIIQGGAERAARLNDVSAAVESCQRKIDQLQRQRQAMLSLLDAVEQTRSHELPQRLAALRTSFVAAGLNDQEWATFDLRFAGDVDSVLRPKLANLDTSIDALQGKGQPSKSGDAIPQSPIIADDTDLSTVALRKLQAEAERLRGLIGLDAANTQKLAQLVAKISQAEIALGQLDESVTAAEGASDRREALVQLRRDQYASIFDGIAIEESELEAMYAPLRETLAGEEGALGKLTFSVRRNVNIDAWTARGEGLMDLRTGGPFRGRGALLAVAREMLLPAWLRDSSGVVADAMQAFRAEHDSHILAHAPVQPTDRRAYLEWGARVAEWLTSTDHISVSYGVQYDGVDIEQLSPGTRGIVLLLLYLSIDRNDDRPLIVDQPEENLDPKSIFVELVDRFRMTKLRRQIIIVTHNANLIVNTDVDQVIVAQAGPHRPGELPEISYLSGGLEDPDIRRHVCEILEGGEIAFKERARRLRVDFSEVT